MEITVLVFGLLSVLVVGGFVFMKMSGCKTLREGILDFLKWLSYHFLGWKPQLDYNLYLSYLEIEVWVELLETLVTQPLLTAYVPNEFNGILSITIEFVSFANVLQGKTKKEQQRALAFSLSRCYKKLRGLTVDWRMFFFHSFTTDSFEIWIPLNQDGLATITRQKKERRDK